MAIPRAYVMRVVSKDMRGCGTPVQMVNGNETICGMGYGGRIWLCPACEKRVSTELRAKVKV